MVTMVEEKLLLGNAKEAANIFGFQDEFIRIIEQKLALNIVARGTEILLKGQKDSIERAKEIFKYLAHLTRQGTEIDLQVVNYAINMSKENKLQEVKELTEETIVTTTKGKLVKGRTVGQSSYLKALKDNEIVFGIGPAGTGKTYLAVAMAVSFLKQRKVSRIILTRPAVEAGEKLGFLPGDLQEKVNPYLRPLYDALNEMLGVETTQKYIERGVIEIAPLAYMRGRTLEESYVILDEAQNTTREQMKMFLTRLGKGSRAAITGDITQVDLPRGQFSGLIEVQSILKDIEGISIQYLTEIDVVRHPLVQKIIEAYGKAQQQER